MEVNSSGKMWLTLSVICFILGVIAWAPNIIFGYGYGYWIWTFVINPIGAIFGVKARSKFGIISNAVMTFSFFIVMFAGYIANALY